VIGQLWQPADHDADSSAVTLHHGRLARFLAGSTGAEYWDGHWQEDGEIGERLRRVEAGKLEAYDDMFAGHAAPGLYVEAGCGTGYVAEILRRRGLRVVGLDYDAKTIARVSQVFPELDVRVGDVEALEFADGSVGNYISLGVLEHLEHGPQKAIAEVARVLERHGKAFISVPDLNTARRAFERYLQNHGAPRVSDNCTFNYYYYGRTEFSQLLTEGGLRVDELLPLFKLDYLTLEHPIFSRFWRSRLCRQRVKRPLRRLINAQQERLRSRYSHMMMYVCSKSP